MTDRAAPAFLHNLPLAFALVFGTLLALAGLMVAAVGFVTLRRWFSSRHWPQVPARIVSSEVREVSCFEDQLMYRPEVKYTYAAGGGDVTGSDVAFAGKLYRTREQAVKASACYPPGMMVMARYNPGDPVQAVLVRRGGLAGLLLAGLGLAMIMAPLTAARQAGMPAGLLGVILAGLAATAALLGWWSGFRFSRARRAGIYPPAGTGSDADVERLARQGERTLAIRLYRELYGGDLKTARLRVAEMVENAAGGRR